ncbi:MAG TPA: hypothetical protein VK689_03485 [Armatimonadota bacterium]|nr:hypothetical protein [Armatimonadota bacterium]
MSGSKPGIDDEPRLDERLDAVGPADAPRNDAVPADHKPNVPDQPDPPARHEQDTQAVDGDAAIHPQPQQDLLQRQAIQG